ncbi:MAG: hypothetical protein IKU15_06020 [Clostridia bacterium]|nr:hypothetical protein [Clostridia bacterium]
MNSKTYFIVGRRYRRNDGLDSYFVFQDDYTRAGYRYVYLRSDLTGYKSRHKVHLDKDGNEYVDLLGGGAKDVDLGSNFILLSASQTEYITMTDNETKLLSGEEVELSPTEIVAFLNKGVFADGQRFVLKKA